VTHAEVSFVLESGYRCFAVFGAARFGQDESLNDSTLIEWLEPTSEERTLVVKAGAQFGPYEVAVRIGEKAPDEQDASWEDIAEVSLVSDGFLALGDLEDGTGDPIPVSPGVYRLRVSCRGRTESAARESAFPDEDTDEDTDEESEEPLERYLLDLWPAAFADAVSIKEASRFARDQVSPPEPDWPAEREPGLEAARRVAADLRRDPGGRTLSGQLSEAVLVVEVDGSPLRIFNRLKYAHAWPPGNGGMISDNKSLGDGCTYYGDPPDSDGLTPLLGTIETTVLELDKPRRFSLGWNWRVAGPDGAPYPTNPVLLHEDSKVTMTFAAFNHRDEQPRTRVTIQHAGVPQEWVEDLRRLWAWDVAIATRR